MPQHALDRRRATTVPGYETTARGPVAADTGMLARHEHRTRQREASHATAELELRARRLHLLELGG